MAKLRTVALLARKPGVLILDELLANPHIVLCRVYTHAHLPKCETPPRPASDGRATGVYDPIQNPDITHTNVWVPDQPIHNLVPRPEVAEMVKRFPGLQTDLESGVSIGEGVGAPFDLLIVCNWRKLIPAVDLSRFRYAINIHRGDLPKYPGKRPVRQAIEAGDQLFAITAHHMTPELDKGEVIRKAWHQTRIKFAETEDDAEIRIRTELEPHYARLVRDVIDHLIRKRDAA